MTVMGAIRCCYECEERQEGCHSTCERYLEEKKKHQEYLKKVREGKKALHAGYSQNLLDYKHVNGKRMKRGQR